MNINVIKETNGEKTGILFAPDGRYIAVECDFVHTIQAPDDNLYIGDNDGVSVYMTEIKSSWTPTEFMNWAHYWGIKSRVRTNYRMFLDSCKEIGIDTSTFPEWPK